MGRNVSRLVTLGLLLGCAGRNRNEPEATFRPATVESSESASSPRLDGVVPECFGDSWRAGETTACNSYCRSQSFIVTRCIESHREEMTVRAPCECGPAGLSAELASCHFDQLSLVPRQVIPPQGELVNPVDGCQLELTCDAGKLTVSCDGEEDGTGTSLCDCYLDGQRVHRFNSAPWPGEGAHTCHAAAALCLRSATSNHP